MSMLSEIGTGFTLWIDAVAGTVKGAFERFESVRRIELEEDDDGAFTIRPAPDHLQDKARPAHAAGWSWFFRPKLRQRHKKVAAGPLAGPLGRVRIVDGVISGLAPETATAFRDSRVDLALRPSRFLFRPLDLPKRATEFLDGIIRAQIDRLTPWSAGDAVYHWTRPTEAAGERIAMTIVASARTMVVPLAQAFADLGASVVEVSTLTPGADRVTVYCQQTRAAAGLGRIRIVLLTAFAATGAAVLASIGVAGFLAPHYDDELAQTQRRIAERRAVTASQNGAGGSAVDLLERRKQTTPSSVMIIEALSALLPDHTYATELQIEGDKLQITGFTHDAPSLISLLEQSPHFTHATFFAPTTRAPNDPGERFHIEAKIKPYFKAGTGS
jgi:general secretion pathway protein L